ncbi:MAG: segregation/condensation protein A [Candidatus Actinomarina sp.]
MQIEYLIENLEGLLIKYSTSKSQVEEDLRTLFKKIGSMKDNTNFDNFTELILLAASIFELKAKRMLPQEEEIDWLDEITLIKDKDLAFARLLQFKAFSEVGIAFASRIKSNENEVSAFKYYQTKNLFSKPDVEYFIDISKFLNLSEEVFRRYSTIEGFKHIDRDLPDLQSAIDSFLKVIDERLSYSFESMIKELRTSQEAIAFFLALLESIRWGFVKAEQIGDDITIEKNYES